MLHITPVTFKVLIIGANNVGKTSIIQRFVNNNFVPQYYPTIGVDFFLKTIQCAPGITGPIPKPIILQLWDVAGQKNFHTIMPYYVIGTQGILLTCDSTNPLTLAELDEYLGLINLYLDTTTIPMILISTKHDLSTTLNQTDIEKFMYKNKIREYLPTSAVIGLNVNIVFQHIGQLMAENLISLKK